MEAAEIIDELIKDLRPMRYGPPVTHVYNPLEYARSAYEEYLRRYGTPPKEIVLLGMNPGPWGMAQTGVPFGDVHAVREWLGIHVPVGAPGAVHPKRPIEGLACMRREVSGKRLWGWARRAYGTPERFFSRFFVANYCPLLFIEESGRNRTPDNLRASEKNPLLEICDRALRRTIEEIKPRWVVGIGRFAEARARKALVGRDVQIGGISHPSPANPRANRGWEALVVEELASMGIYVP
ncbi:MAG: uracil-DNA glycosylase family protein [Desulfatiglandales bacterium]